MYDNQLTIMITQGKISLIDFITERNKHPIFNNNDRVEKYQWINGLKSPFLNWWKFFTQICTCTYRMSFPSFNAHLNAIPRGANRSFRAGILTPPVSGIHHCLINMRKGLQDLSYHHYIKSECFHFLRYTSVFTCICPCVTTWLYFDRLKYMQEAFHKWEHST